MTNKTKKILTVFLGLCSISFARAGEVPNYNEIFAQQLKCNNLYFSKSPWDKKLPLLAKMDTSTVVIISQPVITELSPKIEKNALPDYKNRKHRDVKVNSTFFTKVTCNPKNQIDLKTIKGSLVETIISITETKANTGMFNISGGEPADFLSTDSKINSDYLYYAGENENRSGFFCVVLIDDFLKNPNAINIEKLCQGKSAKDHEATKNAIEQTKKALVAADVGKTK